ncbi:MAG: Hsp33 family molecular chaperone HslO [Candidatus Nitricoxidivorans perseverans]|uniref:Hsp33 family molecular chaperone HslO n=1 Tax=Candidatus Nitricoxidivorans perseverans TaxID=2975601 RepID=A0AA49IZ33_9PROT|nr:MAG: Hsp33 family molecular chaperone HslO [Candidatus Nitricoxidivorans perseverans]
MDTVRSFLFENLDIRGALVLLGPVWREMQAGRGYAPAVRNLLGEMAAVTALVASNLKSPGRLTFHLQGHGPVRLLVMDCDEQLRMRGSARAPEDAAPASAAALLGDGKMTLTLQVGAAPQPYQSLVPLEGGSVADFFGHYLTQSEQSPSRLWLHADGAHACGLLLQKLPEADSRDPDGWNRVQHLASTLRPGELALPAETLLAQLFPDETLRLFDPRHVAYHCPRDEGKVLGMLAALGREEVERMLSEHGGIAIHDDICNHDYRFGREVLEQLFTPPSKTLH